jgi:hypothetical protein
VDKSWKVDVQENEDGELFIQLNDEILAGTGFQIGDDLEWEDNKDGSWTLKKSDKVWVMVECTSTYRMRYMVQAPAAHPEYALDDVTMSKTKEFSQLWLGEQIVSHRVVSTAEALKLCDEDNSYCSEWEDEHKIDAFFTKEGEGNGL